MQIDKIPASLQSSAKCCLWRKEQRNGRTTKIPYNPHTLRLAKPNMPNTFGTFQDALQVYQKGGYDGLGVGIFGDLAAVDIDHCIDENGELSPMAADIIACMNSYTEISPSGKGIRIFFLAPEFKYDKVKHYINNTKIGLEIYIAGCTNKYVTVTGNSLNGKAISDRSKEIAGVLDKYMKRQNEPKMAAQPLDLSDDELIERARNAVNGAKFDALWRGDFSAYSSQSEAEQALCNMLAFWCGRDKDKMDRLFRQSGLMREKWEREDYRNATLLKAIADCNAVYEPKKSTDNKSNTAELLKPKDFTDMGNAHVFAREYKGKAIYVKSIGWLVWNGKKWAEDDLEARRLAMTLTDRMLAEARQQMLDAHNEGDKAREKKAERYFKHVLSSRSHTRIAGLVRLAQPLLQLAPDKLDAHPYLLNTPAGIVDLRTGEIKPHDPSKYCSKITKCSPSRESSGMLENFFFDISKGDTEMTDFLQQISGMSAIGKVFEENLIIVLGDGANGKSTFFNALMIVLGDYAGTIAAEILTTANRSKGAELAMLKGKRLVIAAELEEGARLSSSMVKQITSTDKIHAERKYKDPEDFTPSHTTILYTNHLPRVGSTDSGTWRRLSVVPFIVKIDKSKAIKNFAEVLANDAGDALMQWMIDGAVRFHKSQHKLSIPDFVTEAIDKYRSENDWMQAFLDECCDVEKGKVVASGKLYEEYRYWADKTGEYKRNSKDFKAELDKRGFEFHKTNKRNVWYGIAIKQSDFIAN